MSITEFSVLPRGTRIRVRRGHYPTDPARLGRAGVVVSHSPYDPNHVEVSLDGEPGTRVFAVSEVEVVAAPDALPPDHREARKRLARP